MRKKGGFAELAVPRVAAVRCWRCVVQVLLFFVLTAVFEPRNASLQVQAVPALQHPEIEVLSQNF